MNMATWPTTALSQDHQVVLSKLLELEQAVAARSEGEPDAQVEGVIRGIAGFLQSEIPPHFDREEKLLFPPLAALGMQWTGLLAVILAEHEGLHELRAKLMAAIADADREPRGLDEVRRRADDFLIVLRRHINKEDTLIFPMAEKDLGSERLAEIAAEMHHDPQA